MQKDDLVVVTKTGHPMTGKLVFIEGIASAGQLIHVRLVGSSFMCWLAPQEVDEDPARLENAASSYGSECGLSHEDLYDLDADIERVATKLASQCLPGKPYAKLRDLFVAGYLESAYTDEVSRAREL